MSAQSRLPQLWQLYHTNEDRCTAMYLRLRERATDTRQYEHSSNSDAETLRVMDEAGEIMLRQIVAAGGGDVDAILAETDARCADDAPQF
jgi:hypothetical protein